MEDINNYSESYPYGFEFDLGEETAFYHGESQVQYNEAVSVPSFDNSYAKETSSSVIEQGQLMDLNDLIKKIEKLRLEEIALTHRKNNGLVLLTEFSEKGLISSQTEFSTTAETPSELRAVYENLLWKFKETKESWFRKEKNLKEEIKLKTEYLESMREKCSNLAINQDELELSAGLKMVHPKTGKKLDRDVIVNIIDNNRKQNKRIIKLCMKHLTENNKCVDIEIKIKNLKSSSTFSIEEYQQFTDRLMKLDLMEAKGKQKLSEVQHIIRNTLERSSNIPERFTELNEIKQNKEIKLDQIKHQWRSNVMKKLQKQTVVNLRKNSNRLDYFTENPLLLKDYEENAEKVKNNEIYEMKLRQNLAKSKATVNCLKEKIEVIKMKTS